MEQKIALGGLLKQIGNYNMDTFEGRLILQKTVYLMQAFGLPLGYRFSWYLYGPYSPDLTKDGYEIKDIYKTIPKLKFVKQDRQKRFDDFIKILGDNKNDAYFLELLASIHFLKKIYPLENKENIVKKVEQKQPYIKKKDCESAWQYLEKIELLN